MCRRGDDLVRRYLWMAALKRHSLQASAVRALWARVAAKHPQHKAVAVGHAMRKLLHLVYAIWKSGRPFSSPTGNPWQASAHVEVSDNGMSLEDKPSNAAAVAARAGRGPQANGGAGADSGRRGLHRHSSRSRRSWR